MSRPLRLCIWLAFHLSCAGFLVVRGFQGQPPPALAVVLVWMLASVLLFLLWVRV